MAQKKKIFKKYQSKYEGEGKNEGKWVNGIVLTARNLREAEKLAESMYGENSKVILKK